MKWLEREGPRRFPFYRRCRGAGLLCSFDAKEVKLGHLRVHPFEVPHDCHNTVGFTIQNARKKLTVATDLGCAPAHILRRFEDSDIMVIESNHDVEMEKNSPRSRIVIRRNLSDVGHLSNEQAQEAVRKILGKSRRHPSHLFLAHLSEECNSPRLAYYSMKKIATQLSLPVKIELTYAGKRSAYVEM
jgi:phosphoribosyl 1,2-cyclic phosphodiesterase